MFTSVLLLKILIIVAVFAVSLGIAAYATYGERKIAGFMQDRYGPDRAGPLVCCNPLPMVVR